MLSATTERPPSIASTGSLLLQEVVRRDVARSLAARHARLRGDRRSVRCRGSYDEGTGVLDGGERALRVVATHRYDVRAAHCVANRRAGRTRQGDRLIGRIGAAGGGANAGGDAVPAGRSMLYFTIVTSLGAKQVASSVCEALRTASAFHHPHRPGRAQRAAARARDHREPRSGDVRRVHRKRWRRTGACRFRGAACRVWNRDRRWISCGARTDRRSVAGGLSLLQRLRGPRRLRFRCSCGFRCRSMGLRHSVGWAATRRGLRGRPQLRARLRSQRPCLVLGTGSGARVDRTPRSVAASVGIRLEPSKRASAGGRRHRWRSSHRRRSIQPVTSGDWPVVQRPG